MKLFQSPNSGALTLNDNEEKSKYSTPANRQFSVSPSLQSITATPEMTYELFSQFMKKYSEENR